MHDALFFLNNTHRHCHQMQMITNGFAYINVQFNNSLTIGREAESRDRQTDRQTNQNLRAEVAQERLSSLIAVW